MTAPTIALSDLAHDIGGRRVLDIDRLTVSPGATAVLGPNGSGKSTLLRHLATVTETSTGSTRIDGLDPRDHVERTAIRRRLGYVAQDDGLPARMRVDAYCDYVGALKEIREARLRRRWTTWALARVGLRDVAGQRIGTLSGGMRRRLSIAQALLGGPDLLVLDEPLSGLDGQQRADVANLIVTLAASTTIVCATHHADEVATLCHRVVVLDGGRCVFHGSPSELASRAQGRVWESDHNDPSAICRAIGPGRFRCVGTPPVAGHTELAPTVADGYFTTVTP